MLVVVVRKASFCIATPNFLNKLNSSAAVVVVGGKAAAFLFLII